MSRIRGSDTAPERAVRSILHRLGLRFSLRRKELPGKPDIVLPARGAAVFVHGCFWHQHPGCRLAVMPQTRREFWTQKLSRNVARDDENVRALKQMGWKVVTVWECELAAPERVASRLGRLLGATKGTTARS